MEVPIFALVLLYLLAFIGVVALFLKFVASGNFWR
jgi:hypothetical protein